MRIDAHKIEKLEGLALEARQLIVKALTRAGSGHTAGSLDLVEILTYLFFHGLRHNPQMPDWQERDRLVLSNGHTAPGLYAVMSLAGYASPAEFENSLRKFGSKFQGHPHRDFFPALETSSGPLGSGLSQSVGMALSQRMDWGQVPGRFFFCILSDAEMQSGETWEAAMLAGKEKLGNLIAIIDRNNIQIGGYTEEVMPVEPLHEKWRSFNWHTIDVDGHNFAGIDDAVNEAKSYFLKPSVIIARTIPGKGVSVFEGKYEWHGKVPNAEEATKALRELESIKYMLKKK